MRLSVVASIVSLAVKDITATPVSYVSSVRLDISKTVEAGSVHNIRLTFNDDSFEGPLTISYGSCSEDVQYNAHHTIGSALINRAARPDRFVWVAPEDIPHNGCLHAHSGSRLVGRSEAVHVLQRAERRENLANYADAMGPWFDGVQYIQSTNLSAVSTEEAKSKKIAIVGGGMSGLLTSLLLDSVGMSNWHITESSGRVGGRIRTKYLNGSTPSEYQYQEMGPMRFPVSIRYSDTNETFDIQDHKMVFQLADVLNRMNNNSTDLAVNFIPWIQSSPNTPVNTRGYRLPNGRVPNKSQLSKNSSLANSAPVSSNPEMAEWAASQIEAFEGVTPEKMRNISQNIYKAHKQAVEHGMFHFSEAAYLRYALNMDDDIVDFVAGSGNSPIWVYDSVYFSATTWRTIDQGLERLPKAFMPHVQDRLTLNRKITGLAYNNATSKVSLSWREDPLSMTTESEEYDYAVVAVPFTKVRLWSMPQYSSLLSRAINTMNYAQSCKVALHYKSRFWEHLDYPIYGGCGTIDTAGIGSICYPSYKINSTGPGVILGSYVSSTLARSVAALSEADHVAMVQRAMVEVHGDIAAQEYTGNYDRQCWEVDEHQAGAWAAPTVGQQDLYLPAYYQTEFNTIFVGEHTSYTHAWIFSALDSAVRGTAQLLLDLGLVDEAKEVVNTWMGRWINV